jgi:hypothetical protein
LVLFFGASEEEAVFLAAGFFSAGAFEATGFFSAFGAIVKIDESMERRRKREKKKIKS